jgi:hypothetical protein
MCFVAMPFGPKAPSGRKTPLIDFDAIYSHIAQAVQAEDLECVRADFEPGGGFVHRAMFERLLVAEYVVADLTLANPNVAYEIGVRHGASSRPTILIGAGGEFMKDLPFDFRPLRVLPYDLGQDGSLSAEAATALVEGLRERLRQARAGTLPVDNPIMQVTTWSPTGRLEHDKTDVFLQRLRYAGEFGERVAVALDKADPGEAIAVLQALEQEIVDSEVVPQLHSALLGIYLGYREKKAYQRMVDLVPRLPGELQQTAVVQEQLALALNRLAEQAVKEAAALGSELAERAEQLRDVAQERRKSALHALDQLSDTLVTSETHGIRGRIYKGWHDAERAAGNEARARAMLSRAIDTYEAGVRGDLRDYYPGVNAVTLRLLRGSEEDLAALGALVPVVRMAVDSAPAAESEEERYWQAATKLELACSAKDWEAAQGHLDTLLGIDAQDWMRETTTANLGIQQRAFHADVAAVGKLDEIARALRR